MPIPGLVKLQSHKFSLAISFSFSSDTKLKASSNHFAYKQSLVREMKNFVDSFYRDMTRKIGPIIKKRKREIRDMKAKMKYLKKRMKSEKQREGTRDSIASSNDTVSTFREKQLDGHKEMVQLVSLKNIPEQSLNLNIDSRL